MLRPIQHEIRVAAQVLRETITAFIADGATRKGAALAYYTVFSLAPLLVISISVAGIFFSADAARTEIVGQLGTLIGGDGARMIETLLENATQTGKGVLAGVFGVLTLLFAATTALAELKDALDEVWDVPPERTRGFLFLVRKRLLSLSLILVLGFLLLVSLIFSAGVTALQRYWTLPDDTGIVLQSINILISFVLVAAMFAMIYKLLPATRIAWRDVITGALCTALLFTLGKWLIGLYLGNSAVASSYGAAGSIVLLLLWVFYSAQIFLLGAEFTKVYAHRRGSRRNEPTPAKFKSK